VGCIWGHWRVNSCRQQLNQAGKEYAPAYAKGQPFRESPQVYCYLPHHPPYEQLPSTYPYPLVPLILHRQHQSSTTHTPSPSSCAMPPSDEELFWNSYLPPRPSTWTLSETLPLASRSPASSQTGVGQAHGRLIATSSRLSWPWRRRHAAARAMCQQGARWRLRLNLRVLWTDAFLYAC
jgi:hypothetical protein